MKQTVLLIFFLSFIPQAVFGETWHLSMLPRYDAAEISSRINPLAEYLSKKLDVSVKPLLMSNFSEYISRTKRGDVEIGFQNPYVYTQIADGHEVVAMAVKGKNGDRFRGVIIVRNDSEIESLDDLKGKDIAIVGVSSAGGYLSQKLTLMRHGIDVDKDCRLIEAVDNKHENVLLSVFVGDVDAGFIRESALTQTVSFVPISQIRVMNESAWLANWALSVKRSLPERQKNLIRKIVTELPEGDAVLKALKIKNFRSATDSEYDSVRMAAGIELNSYTH